MSKKRDVEFLYEMGQLRLVKRMWRRFFHSEVANVAEHTLRVAWIALAIAKREGSVDEEKILKMAILHDISESRTGDVDYVSRQYVERKEELAIKDILGDTIFGKEYEELWRECEERKTKEAKIIKDADNLEVSLELREQLIQPISSLLAKGRERLVKLRLYTKTARDYWKLINHIDPNDWHSNTRNRFNAGDWKRK